jgi:hypothetical protein
MLALVHPHGRNLAARLSSIAGGVRQLRRRLLKRHCGCPCWRKPRRCIGSARGAQTGSAQPHSGGAREVRDWGDGPWQPGDRQLVARVSEEEEEILADVHNQKISSDLRGRYKGPYTHPRTHAPVCAQRTHIRAHIRAHIRGTLRRAIKILKQVYFCRYAIASPLSSVVPVWGCHPL